MRTVYYKAGDAEWRYDLDDEEFGNIIKNLEAEEVDFQEVMNDSLEVLRDLADVPDDEMDEDDVIDQTISIAVIWHYFNNLPEEERMTGDIAIIENDDGEGVTILPASAVMED